MPAITHRDYQAMLDGIGRLYGCSDLDGFPAAALTEVIRLVGADSSTFNYVAPTVPKVTTVAIPSLPDQDKRTERFAQYLPQHSALTHFLATGDPGAFKLSDFQSEREYHALPLYQEFYRELQYEDQFTFMRFPPGSELIGISLGRSRRSFTERDRQILDLLRPHIARAYRQVERLALFQRALGGAGSGNSPARVTRVRLNSRGRPVEFGTEAQRWLDYFFPIERKAPAGLPAPVCEFLRGTRWQNGRAPARGTRAESLMRDRAGLRLRLRVFPDSSGDGRLLVMGLEINPGRQGAQPLGGLTQREIEVLLQVELGKTNEEVSAVLGTSPLTVRRHLENIYEKLGVHSRTAAVTRLRQMYRDGLTS